MLDVLLLIKQTVETAKDENRSALSDEQIVSFNVNYDQIVAAGLRLNPTPQKEEGKRGPVKQSFPKNMLDRLRDHKEKVLALMNDFQVPFDNNLTERDIHMTKVRQKVSGGFRSEEGGNVFCQIRSYISTARKNGQTVLEVIYNVLLGTPYTPPFIPM
jgi:transposase